MYFDIVKLDPANNYILLNQETLDGLKNKITDINQYIADMQILFTLPLESVVTKKTSPSDNIHDYASMATYYWPNPDHPSGLPYYQRDGHVNPEGVLYDKDKLRRLSYLVYHAGILLYITKNTRYKELIERHLQHFFVDPETCMNPNMNHGQFIPGITDGRKEGIIDYSANFTYALAIIKVLNDNSLLDNQLINELKGWHQQFYQWLTESSLGQAERKANNNHGTFYDLAILVIKDFLGKKITKEDKEHFLKERVAIQIEKDGSLPFELRRTKSLSYTLMGFKGLLELSYILKLTHNPKVKKSVEWIAQNALENIDNWKYPQVTQFDYGIFLLINDSLKFIYKKEYESKNDILRHKVINKTLWYLHKKNIY